MKDSEAERLYLLSSLNNSLRVLETFLGHASERGVSELAESLGMNKSTCHRLLVTLKAIGAIEQTESQKYRLGFRWCELGRLYKNQVNLVEVAAPIMERIAANLDVTLRLATLNRGRMCILARTGPYVKISAEMRPLFGRPLISSALGKVLLSRLLDSQLENFLKANGCQETFSSPKSTSLLKEELRQVSAVGHAVDDCESSQLIGCVAAPIFDDRNRLVGAVGISGPSRRLPRERVPFMVERAKSVASRISWELGWYSG